MRSALQEAFKECGDVTQVRLPMDRETGELKGIGFIEFGTVEAKVRHVFSPTGQSCVLCPLRLVPYPSDPRIVASCAAGLVKVFSCDMIL